MAYQVFNVKFPHVTSVNLSKNCAQKHHIFLAYLQLNITAACLDATSLRDIQLAMLLWGLWLSSYRGGLNVQVGVLHMTLAATAFQPGSPRVQRAGPHAGRPSWRTGQGSGCGD